MKPNARQGYQFDYAEKDGSTMKIEHVSRSAHRLDPKQGNPREAVFAEAWKKEAPRTLGWLIGENANQNSHDYTQRDATVAATLIQWLGSPVGFSFLVDCIAECGYRLEEKRTPRRTATA